MWNMAALLTPAGRANLAAVSVALPAPPLPADPHATAAGSDARSGAAFLTDRTVKLSKNLTMCVSAYIILSVHRSLNLLVQAGLTYCQCCFILGTRM